MEENNSDKSIELVINDLIRKGLPNEEIVKIMENNYSISPSSTENIAQYFRNREMKSSKITKL